MVSCTADAAGAVPRCSSPVSCGFPSVSAFFVKKISTPTTGKLLIFRFCSCGIDWEFTRDTEVRNRLLDICINFTYIVLIFTAVLGSKRQDKIFNKPHGCWTARAHKARALYL